MPDSMMQPAAFRKTTPGFTRPAGEVEGQARHQLRVWRATVAAFHRVAPGIQMRSQAIATPSFMPVLAGTAVFESCNMTGIGSSNA